MAVATVKLCKVAAPKESQPAACGRRAREAIAGCDSFGSLIMKSLTAVTTPSQADLAFVAGVEVEGQRLGSRLFYMVIECYNGYDL